MAMNVAPSGRERRGPATRVSTRPWTRNDASWYVDHLDGEIARWTLEPSGLDEAAWSESLSKSVASGTIWHAIECCGNPVGNVKAVPLSDHIAISYWVAEEERGKGYASEALSDMTHLAAANGWGRPIELEIHPDNEASIRTAVGVGYEFYEMRETCDACADDTGRSAIYRWQN